MFTRLNYSLMLLILSYYCKMSNTQLNSDRYLGIDVSKNELVIYNPINNRTYSINNNQKAIRDFIKKISNFGTNRMILEATGRYDYVALLEFQNADYTVYRINPRYIKSFGKSFGNRAKTDKLDSKIISLYGERIKPSSCKINIQIEELRLLMNRRQQITTAISKEKQYKSSITDNKVILKSVDNHLKYLEKELKNIDEILDKIILEDEDLKYKEELVSSCIGVGKIVSKSLIVYLPELGNINNNQISSLIGVAPKNFDSGKFSGTRYISGGRQNIRNILYMSAISLLSHKNNNFYIFYQRLIKKGKNKKLAIVAMIRKLIITLNAMIKNNQTYNKNYVWK